MKEIVLITGSRSIRHSQSIPLIVDSLIRRKAEIIVGDAPGVDRLVVYEAVKRGYASQVTVVGARGICRNSFAFGRVKAIITLNTAFIGGRKEN